MELKWDFLDLDIFKQGMLTPKFPEEGRPPKFPEEDYVRRVMVAFELRQENKRKARTRRIRLVAYTKFYFCKHFIQKERKKEESKYLESDLFPLTGYLYWQLISYYV